MITEQRWADTPADTPGGCSLITRGAGRGNGAVPGAVGAGVGLDQIAGWLEAAGVPPGAVVVGDAGGREAPDAVWRIRAVGQGEWEVFWTQDGTRRAWVRFDDEATACFALLGRLTWARLVRGRP